MKRQNRWWIAMTALAVLALGNRLAAAEPVPTTITIPGMHCSSCAKGIVAKLNEVPGVAAVQFDVNARTTVVKPQAQKTLSPRALWEAVEKAGKQPSKLEGPSGAFTAKPQS